MNTSGISVVAEYSVDITTQNLLSKELIRASLYSLGHLIPYVTMVLPQIFSIKPHGHLSFIRHHNSWRYSPNLSQRNTYL